MNQPHCCLPVLHHSQVHDHEYLTQCYECLFENGAKPACYIRLDRSHVVATILRNKSFTKEFGKQNDPKNFYRRLIGFLIQQSDIEVIEKTIRNAFVLVFNRYLTPENFSMQQALESTTKTHKIDKETEVRSPQNQKIPDSRFNEKKSKFYQWVEKIAKIEEESAKSSPLNKSDASIDDSVRKNSYYGPDLAKTLIDIFSKLPLTSFVMNKSFNRKNETPTSSATEAGFRVMKNSVFAGTGRIRVDTWLERHLKYLMGKSLNENNESNLAVNYEDVNNDDNLDYDDIGDQIDLFVESDSEDGNESSCEGNSEDELIIESDNETDLPIESEHETETEEEARGEKKCEKIIETEIDLSQTVRTIADLRDDKTASRVLPTKCASRRDKKQMKSSKGKIDPFDGNEKHEPWMGQTDECKPPILKYPQRCRHSILNVESLNTELLPTLKYGCEYKLGKTFVTIVETCSNDSLAQIFFSIYADSIKCRASIDESNGIYESIIKLAMNERVIKRVDVERGQFLRKVFNDYCNKYESTMSIRKRVFRKETDSIIYLDCNTSIHTMLEMISENSIFHSIDLFTVCEICKIIFEKNKLVMAPVNVNLGIGIENLEICLVQTSKKASSNCSKCGEILNIMMRPNRIIFVDIEVFKGIDELDSPFIEFSKIPQQIKYLDTHFNIKAVIERTSIGGGGHYIAHVKRNSLSWESFDNTKPLHIGKPPTEMHAMQLVYLMQEDEEVDDKYEKTYTIEYVSKIPRKLNLLRCHHSRKAKISKRRNRSKSQSKNHSKNQ